MKITSLIKYITPGLVVMMIAVLGLFNTAPRVQAASLADWNPGRIIDDAVFTNSTSMDVPTIQSFLNSKVPSCDTNGTQPSEFGGGTRAQWGQAHYGQSTFVCLRDYQENGKSAAQIIHDKAQEFSINPQVLIVLLQKEQGLVTDTWPLNIQYRTATGYGCPDTAACDTQYYGFTNQVTWSARMFRAIMNASPTWYTPYVLGNNFIRYNPNADCGGSQVNIENRSTQALYNYTPYQPNQGALNSGYGTAPCGAYGNRNFYLYFVDWFGSTTRFNGTVLLSSSINVSRQNPTYTNDIVTASYTVSNSASYPVDVGGLGVCGRLNGINYDFGFRNSVSIEPNGSVTISFAREVDRPGVLTVFLCSYNERVGGWADSKYPYSSNQYARQAVFEIRRNPLITSGLNLSPSTPTLSQPITASFTVQNNSSSSVTIPSIGVAVRDAAGNNVGYPSDNNVVIAPNSSYTYSKTRAFTDISGNYRFFVTSFINGSWNDSYPENADGIGRNLVTAVYENPVITTGVAIAPASPTLFQPVTATFTIRNNSSSPVTVPFVAVAVRDAANNNVGFPGDSNVVIAANSTYTYSKTRTFTGNPGSYRFFVTSFSNNIWDDARPANLPSAPRSITAKVYNNPVISTGLGLSPSSPSIGEPVTASFTVQNNSSSSVTIPSIGVAVRDAAGNNVGFPGDSNVVIAANSTYTYSKTRTFTGNPGSYRFFVTSFVNGSWNDGYPEALDGIGRSIIIAIP